jgi:hypothetical protein
MGSMERAHVKILLTLLLITQLAYADLQVKRAGTDYVFSYVEGGVHHCWIMPEWVDLNYFDSAWRTVPDTAMTYNWPTPTLEQISYCDASIPRVSYGKMYQLDGSTSDIPLRHPCGARMSDITFLHAVTYAGRFGFAICSGG